MELIRGGNVMNNLSKEKKQDLLDSLGKIVVRDVRDMALRVAIDIAKFQTVNPGKLEQYKALSGLSLDQQEAVCDLLSETITDTIYLFLEMFEEHDDVIKFLISKGSQEYNLTEISEKMGSEIACFEDDGWIQKFSKIGRFVL